MLAAFFPFDYFPSMSKPHSETVADRLRIVIDSPRIVVTTLLILWAVMIGIGGFMLLYFKKKKWL